MKSRFTTFTFWSIGFIFLSFCSVFYALDRSLAMAQSISVVQVMLFANLTIPYMLESKRNYLFFLKGIVLEACFIIIHLCFVTLFQGFLTERFGETIGINPNVVGYSLTISGLIALFLF
ncbi:hypothetical protein [uncultured Sphaerochaeta sp.]|uniref:hypothetical protein n=1 Tax=uncultured Sphaerochaeta sp. TaxID=886478 RepID=UPI002A0A9F3C|nr:hypothetical protein [uncultured Sphaerochaeta sp.]